MLTSTQLIPIGVRPELYQILVARAREINASISDLVNQAIQSYVAGVLHGTPAGSSAALLQEAQRQSLLTRQHDAPDSGAWEANLDDSEWRP